MKQTEHIPSEIHPGLKAANMLCSDRALLPLRMLLTVAVVLGIGLLQGHSVAAKQAPPPMPAPTGEVRQPYGSHET